jgi:hypothetical protein
MGIITNILDFMAHVMTFLNVESLPYCLTYLKQKDPDLLTC